jgi:hypothetical protein
MTRWIEVRRTTGAAIVDKQGRTLTPEAQAVTLRLPGAHGGLVWNRPVAVRVQGPDGTVTLPVPDVTRRAQLAMLVATGLLLVWAAALSRHWNATEEARHDG